ncbi:hypothetical protein TNCV_3695871 [Trichonephila clavipes]|nr:hypothetical protein TNCV_3695871 [Trichonephila clavipes]
MEKSDEHLTPPSGVPRISLSSFRVRKTRPDSRVEFADGKKVTNTHRRAGAVGCRCHPFRVQQDDRIEELCLDGKSDEHPPAEQLR